MSDDKFDIIDETKVGTLDDTMRAEWDRLYAEHLKLMKLQDAHEQAMDEFWAALHRQFGHHSMLHEGNPELHVSEDGDVYVKHCKCPVCQASVHGLTVVETVEKMYKSDLIPHHAIEVVRARAQAVDKNHQMRKKMMN